MTKRKSFLACKSEQKCKNVCINDQSKPHIYILQKGWSWKPKLTAPVIDFKILLNEWKSKLKSKSLKQAKSSQTKTKKGEQIKNLAKSNWLKVAIVSFAFFASSSYDLISDGLLTHSFIGGTNYTKQFKNQPDSKLSNKTGKSCSAIVCIL